LGIWTWTVVSRSRNMERRLDAMENSLKINPDDADSVAEHTATNND
jgi:hypothetical protein